MLSLLYLYMIIFISTVLRHERLKYLTLQ